MKVFELMAALAKCPAGADVIGGQPGYDDTDLEFVETDGAGGDDGGYVSLQFAESEQVDESED